MLARQPSELPPRPVIEMQSVLGTAVALRKVSNGIGGRFARAGPICRQLGNAYQQAVLYGEVLIERLERIYISLLYCQPRFGERIKVLFVVR